MRVLKPARNAASRGKFFAQAAAWRTSALKDVKMLLKQQSYGSQIHEMREPIPSGQRDAAG